MKERQGTAFECSHLRQVVKVQYDDWYHLLDDGTIGGLCEAGVYRQGRTIFGGHYIQDLVK